MTFQGNWVDLIILAVLLIYALQGLEQGFFRLTANLFSFLGSLLLALKFYPLVANFLEINFSLLPGLSKALGFLVMALVSEAILGLLVSYLYLRLPKSLTKSRFSQVLGIFPAILDALILLAFVLTLVVILPISGVLKKDITGSRIGGYLVRQTGGLERSLNDVFGGALHDTLTFLTVHPQTGEKIDLHYRLVSSQLKVDESSEQIMLTLVNGERVKRGIKPLKLDIQIQRVARAHSQDMFERGYFSHVNPDGLDPFQRMTLAGIKFSAAGENIALAPDVYISHDGFMNSEGHKRNILDPQFGRIGLGVVDGGIYGKMFTQDFAD
ncbi:MAG: CvpA family protein [bacterium]|nr:CvpA family protein [bacterium]